LIADVGALARQVNEDTVGSPVTMSGDIGQRKADHLGLCATEDVGFHGTRTLFEDVRLVHDALPDLDEAAVDTSCTILGKRLRAPLLIAAMTGGTEEAGRVNRELALLAEERGLAFGLGSQRAMHLRAGSAATYRVRDVAPSTLILGNVGVVQAREMTTDQVRALAGEIGADALCIHLNPAMELVQAHGDRDFSRGLDTIGRLVAELKLPIVVKETGCGLSPQVARRLRHVGVHHLDVSGAGGTSWVGVETKRAEARGDAAGRSLGETLWEWGIPTAASVALLAPLGFRTLIATGGVANGLDVAKALALGATCAGIARPLLRALHTSGSAGAAAALDGTLRELRAVMVLTASRELNALSRTPRVILGELARWVEQLSRA
jgi:isopentenyl-diphosphate delta-isomerase